MNHTVRNLQLSQKGILHQRQKEEPIAAFVVKLRELAQTCEFGKSLNDMLRDQLVCGVKEDGIQKRLLMEPDSTKR